ncbi:Ribosomal large subunit pseudouridine synthase D [Usitatibacter rugosus]|uniref:Ribosomal large subunit pseudouridine synthase D n=1 Tax=Usitatibacter rugosus TaxID=2732067 RepID=A0A6M4GYE2_9PROT|nr:RluA family pseudouridine synthase [Usitatibacter rugosus]QJR11524.1 Ribosomal large subunit pseudouridine synthase D [Usitatibacter rugosus]
MPSPPPTVAAVVREQTGLSWSRARKLCTDGRVTLDGERCLDPAARVPAGGAVVVDLQAPKHHAGPLSREAILFYDRDVVVIDKPAGMLSVPDVPGNKDTLGVHARTLLRRMGGGDTALGVVHRLDKDTSGPMMFARTATAQRALAAQFRDHEVDRVYHAIAHGAVAAERIETDLLPDRGDGLRGSFGHYKRASGDPPAVARRAITTLAPLTPLKGATLVECRLETGRQHQIRIHLSELGHPLVGERVYIRDYSGVKIESPRPMLHAQTLGFVHPRTGKHVLFQREAPADFQEMLERLQTK